MINIGTNRFFKTRIIIKNLNSPNMSIMGYFWKWDPDFLGFMGLKPISIYINPDPVFFGCQCMSEIYFCLLYTKMFFIVKLSGWECTVTLLGSFMGKMSKNDLHSAQ